MYSEYILDYYRKSGITWWRHNSVLAKQGRWLVMFWNDDSNTDLIAKWDCIVDDYGTLIPLKSDCYAC